MKTTSHLLTLLKVFSLTAAIAVQALPAPAATASPSELLEKGIYNEETKGDLDSAIKIYEELVAAVKTSQSLAAQAQFRLAQCYLKKNKTAEANAAFEKLIHDFPNEKDLVAKARAHVPGDFVLNPVPWVDGERLQLDLKLAAGLNLGTMVYHADLAEAGGRKIWRVGAQTLVGGASGFSSVDADADTFRPIVSRWKHALLGDVTGTYKPGEVEVRRSGEDKGVKINFDKTSFDNEETLHLMRRLPLKTGYKTNITIISTLGGGSPISFGLEVQGKEKLEVPAGKFDSFKVQLSIGQTFWFSDDAHRYLVKFEAGGAVAELASITQHKPGESIAYHNDKAGITLTTPADWVIHYRAQDKPAEPESLNLLDPTADADLAVLYSYATDTLKEESRKSSRAWAEADFKDSHSKTLKDAKVRPDSWKETAIGGQPGVSFLMDYTEGGKPRVGYGIYVVGPKTSKQFVLASAPDKFDALKKSFDSIIASYKSTK